MSDSTPQERRPGGRLAAIVGKIVPARAAASSAAATRAAGGAGAGQPPATAGAHGDAGSAPPPQTDDRFPRRFGTAVIVLAFFGVGGWAAVAAIDGAVVAQGVVTVDSYRKTVQHLEGGIVERIHVRDGDVVEAGDLLIQLDETQARGEYLMNWTRYLAERARQARLQAELDGDEQVTFPDEVLDSAEESARTAQVVRVQRREFTARREAIEGEIAVLRHRRDQLEERIAGMEIQHAATKRTVESLREELDSKRRLVEREALPRSELRPLERELAEREGQTGELRAEIAAARIEAGETELQIIQRRREFSREAVAELSEANNQVDALEEELRVLEDTLRRKQIVAPVDGEVINLQVHAERAVIRGGDPVLDLVPADDSLVIEGRVRPQDIDSVDLGMLADVRFTAFSFRTTPVVEGEVRYVSADRLEDERDGEPYYLARIVVGEEERTKLGPEVALRAGMPADVMIKTGERTPLQYLAKPITDALARSFREE